MNKATSGAAPSGTTSTSISIHRSQGQWNISMTRESTTEGKPSTIKFVNNIKKPNKQQMKKKEPSKLCSTTSIKNGPKWGKNWSFKFQKKSMPATSPSTIKTKAKKSYSSTDRKKMASTEMIKKFYKNSQKKKLHSLLNTSGQNYPNAKYQWEQSTLWSLCWDFSQSSQTRKTSYKRKYPKEKRK